MRVAITGVCLWFPHKGRVPHISLVFREMWDTTALSLWLSKPGGLLISYTDGISEAMTAEDEELGRLGCSKLLPRRPPAMAAEVMEQVLRAPNEFTAGAEQHDDMTFAGHENHEYVTWPCPAGNSDTDRNHPLLCPQRLHRIDGCGAAGRDQRGSEAAYRKQDTDQQNRGWIMFANTKEEGFEGPRHDP
jgi:Stage II sporulation protein E (SpoIIE)